MRFALLSLVCGSLAFVSCDRHSWEDSAEIDATTGEPLAKGTHRLFPADHGHHGHHGDDHGSHGEHAAHDDHGHDKKHAKKADAHEGGH